MCFIDTTGFQAQLEGGRIVARELDEGMPLEPVAFDCDLVAVAEAIDESIVCKGVPRTVCTDDGGLFEVVCCPTTIAPNGERLEAEGLDITIRTPDGDELSGFLPLLADGDAPEGGFQEVTRWAFNMSNAANVSSEDLQESAASLRTLRALPKLAVSVSALRDFSSMDEKADSMTSDDDVIAALLAHDLEQFEQAA